MHSAMQERLTGMIRGGLAVTLASTLMVPTTALAQAADDAASQVATAQGAQTASANSENPEANANANASDNAADAASPTDEQVASLLTPMGGAADEAADADNSGSANLLDGVAQRHQRGHRVHDGRRG